MKKKFILLAMMLLTLIGGVNLNVLNAQEQYRIKSVSTGKYLHIFNHDQHSGGQFGGVGVSDYEESVNQIFTFEPNGTGYRVKSADGYYIYCQQWNVDAYNTSSYFSTTLTGFDFNGESFSIGRMYSSSEYFKVEYVSAGGNTYVFCNCTGNGDGTIETWKLEPVIVDDGIIPAAPTNLVATAIDHKSISLSWTAGDENALKYNIYQGGVNIGSTTETSYTVEGLTAETNYCFTVEAVRGVNVSESHSNEACATTSEAPATRDIVFLLQDSYGDGWNGGYLNVSVNEGTPQKLEFPCSSWTGCITKEYTLSIEVGAKVNVTYYGGSFSSECTYSISYFEGDVIRTNAALDVFEFTVVALTPSVTVTPNSIAFGSVKVGDEYWSEKPEPSFDVNVTAKNTTIKSVSIDDNFFTSDKDLATAAGQAEFNFTVSYDKEAEAGPETGTITVKYMDGEVEKSETISLSATAYVPAEGDVIENPIEVTFDENGSYSSTPVFSGLYDDYILPGETWNEGNNPDAVYKLVLEDKYLVTANVNVGSWMAVYDENFNGVGGPKADNAIATGLSNTVLSAGTYYVLLATNGTFTFTMTASSVPAPTISYSNPTNESANNDNPALTWNMQYADEYQVLFGASEDALEEVATETAIEGQTEYSYQTENLQDNTKYYWQVVATNKAGTTTGEVQSFVTMLPAPQNVVASDYELKAGESTTISWDAVEGALSYKVYNAGELIATLEPTVTEYELTGLEYNMSGHSITVTAVHELGESYPGYATIKVAGSFTLAVSVKDANGKPIEGATVAIDMTNAYDEFQNQITETVTVEATDKNGNTTVTLPLLYQNDYIYDYYIGYIYPRYTVKVSKYPYTENTKDVYYNYSTSGSYVNYIQNNDTYNVELSLTLPEVSGLRFTEEGDEVGPVVMKDSTIDLEWDEVEGATAYKVYTYNHLGEQIGESEIVTETSCEISTADYNMNGFKYGVSALFNDIETSQAFTELIKVTGCGTITGIVKDGTNPVSNIIVHLEGESSIGNEVCPDLITNELGKFEFDKITEGTYTLTISHYDYVEYVRENIEILYGQPTDLGTIILTAKPTAAGITNVTATADGDNANVVWTVGAESAYTKYNVYRRNVEDPQELENIEQNVEATSYTDASWAELETGTYQYGVSTFVEPQAQTRGTEVIFEEGFEDNGTSIPTGWTNQNGEAVSTNFSISQKYVYDGSYTLRFYGGTSTFTRYLVSPAINIGSSVPTLEFYCKSVNVYGYNYLNTINVYVKAENSEWSKIGTISGKVENFTKYEYSLEGKYNGENLQIQFECNSHMYAETFFDNIVVTASSPEVETQIVWSNEVEKKAPVMFYAYEDTDWNNPNNWNVKRLPTAEDEVVILTSVNISSEANANSLNIASGSTVTVDENGVLNVAAGITNNGSLVLNDGGQIFQNNANIYAKFNMGIENPTSWSEETSSKDGWQFISSPFNAAQISLFTGLFTPKSYDLYKYDGTQDLEWINHKSETEFEETFVNGRGYLASYETLTSVELAGYLYYAKSFTWDNLTHTEKDLANFHLLGNPFTFDMDMTAATYNNLVEGVAIVNNEGGYTYDVTTIPVGDGFFVKATGENPTLSYDAEAKATRGVKANSLNVIATSNAGKDNVVINLGGEKAGFNKLQNFNDAIATVYVQDNGANYGIYNCDADVQEIELNFNANQMGNYTISIEPNGKFQTVTLVDRFTGIETNMLVEDYNFTAMSGVNNNRFIIKLAVSDQQSAVSDNFVYQSGEDLIIDAEGIVQIIDVMGRVLLSDEVESTNNRINVSGFQNGTYMVRVINGSEVKVEKVVIY